MCVGRVCEVEGWDGMRAGEMMRLRLGSTSTELDVLYYVPRLVITFPQPLGLVLKP